MAENPIFLTHCENFCQIARELREFEAYKIIDDLRYRMFSFGAPDTTTETPAPDINVYRKCFRITFIGDLSAVEKRKFIDAAFPNARPFQVENLSGDASDIDEAYYYYYEAYDEIERKSKKYRFAIINTPSLTENDQMPDIAELDTDAVVFVISGDTINESEKSCLEKIKYQVDKDFLFFVHPVENLTPFFRLNNKIAIAEKLSVQKDDVKLYGSSESSEISQYFADEHEQCLLLLHRKIRDYMIQFYHRFKINVEAYLRSVSKLNEFNKDLNRIEDATFRKVDRIDSLFRMKLDHRFPIEASYSDDIRDKMKNITRKLAIRELEARDIPAVIDDKTKHLLEDWKIEIESIIADYLQDISDEVNEGLHEFGHTYGLPIPLNCKKMELKVMSNLLNRKKTELKVTSNFQSYILETNSVAEIGRSLPSTIFPALFVYSTLSESAAAGSAAAASAAAPLAIAVFVVSLAFICWHQYEVRKIERTKQHLNEAEKDIKVFNYYMAYSIRIYCAEIMHFSQDALRSIFKEIRKAERKRITIDNACPAIKAITEDSLLEKISRNCKAIESSK